MTSIGMTSNENKQPDRAADEATDSQASLLSKRQWTYFAKLALEEDVGPYDATSVALGLCASRMTYTMRARESLVVCGLPLARACFEYLDASAEVELLALEGAQVESGAELMRITAQADAILTAERSALNYTQRLSGIATLTAQYVKKAQLGGGAAVPKILDTRKTTPGLRLLEKYATQCGGAVNHRMGLFDMVMIKDNHLAALSKSFDRPILEAVKRAKHRFPGLKVEVEVDRLDQLSEAIMARPDRILLDNMDPQTLMEAVAMIPDSIQTEASGGVNLSTIGEIARTGVDFISVGALTHGYRSVDIGLDEH